MTNYETGKHYHKSRILGAAVVAGMLSVAMATAGADSGRAWNLPPGNQMTVHEKAMAARTEAVEHAKIAFEKAKAAGAEWAAPYEYYMADEYLKLAKEELKSGDRIGVAVFGAESEKYSFEAIEKASGGSK